MKDHAVYDNNGNAILTCGDCVEKENVYNFGLCGSPILDKNSEKTIIERGVRVYMVRELLLSGK